MPQGEFPGAIGRDGSGQTTLLRCIAEIHTPTEGKVEVTGRVSLFLELGAGFNQELTARGNDVLALSLIAIPSQLAKERIDEIVEFAELEDLFDSSTRTAPAAW